MEPKSLIDHNYAISKEIGEIKALVNLLFSVSVYQSAEYQPPCPSL